MAVLMGTVAERGVLMATIVSKRDARTWPGNKPSTVYEIRAETREEALELIPGDYLVVWEFAYSVDEEDEDIESPLWNIEITRIF